MRATQPAAAMVAIPAGDINHNQRFWVPESPSEPTGGRFGERIAQVGPGEGGPSLPRPGCNHPAVVLPRRGFCLGRRAAIERQSSGKTNKRSSTILNSKIALSGRNERAAARLGVHVTSFATGLRWRGVGTRHPSLCVLCGRWALCFGPVLFDAADAPTQPRHCCPQTLGAYHQLCGTAAVRARSCQALGRQPRGHQARGQVRAGAGNHWRGCSQCRRNEA
jgi:hypothetical protein